MLGAIATWLLIFFWLGCCFYVARPKGPLQPPPPKPALPPVATLEAELARPLAEIVAEAERKAIAMHCPLEGDPSTAWVTVPGVQHPFDPCYLPHCGEARSQHEHVEMLGTGQYSVRGTTTWTTGSQIEVTAFGDRERSYLPGPPDPPGLQRLRDERLQLWAEARQLCDDDGMFTFSDQCRWDDLNRELDMLDARISALLNAWRKVTSR